MMNFEEMQLLCFFGDTLRAEIAHLFVPVKGHA